MKISIIIITKNSQKWIGKVLKRLEAYLDLPTVQVIFIDNFSNDNTVPIIVNTMGIRFLEEDRIKFFINNHNKDEQEIISKVANCEKRVIIKENKNKRQIEKMIKEKLK